MFSLQSPPNHPIIPRENNVTIEKKHVTVHTEDRNTRLKADGTPIETQSKFSIQLPEVLENVAYAQLKNIQIPTYYVNISERYKNNKLTLTIGGTSIPIIIPTGLYTPRLLLEQLSFLTTADYGTGNNTTFVDPSSSTLGWLFFANNADLASATVTLTFNDLVYDEETDCLYKNSDLAHDYSNPSKKWGLGYELGFNKAETFVITYDGDGNIASTTIDGVVQTTALLSAQNSIRLDYLKTIYLEVNDFNTISEIKPDIGNRNDTFNSGYHGTGSAALAKIPIIMKPGKSGYNILSTQISGEFLESKKLFLNSFKTSVSRLNFVFRDHRGSLIDFSDQDFTFTLEFGVVREVVNRTLNILNFTS